MEPIRNSIEPSPVELKKEDFVSSQTVKWCPGCGSHIILSAVESVFPRIGYKKENFVIVSGIGCSSRFPYYVNTYGFHGIHGRAHAIATGVKLANPGLSVWVSTGDGDSLAIGGNHFIHAIRRNIDMNIVLFNNQIYGLTKGQFSPTTPRGTVTKTSPDGTIEDSFNVGQLVLGAQGTFFARVVDNLPHLLSDVLYLAAKHDGTSVVEILQNCVIFNDKAYEHLTNKDTRDDNLLILAPGEPMIFGKNKSKGLTFENGLLTVIDIEKEEDLRKVLIHKPEEDNFYLHMMLSRMMPPAFPLAVGVIRMVKKPTFDDLMVEQIDRARESSQIRCVDDLLNSGSVFEIN
ncbi:MAG: 2-oxoacid:ferredoxin oxidoreductase subunit beta [Bacteroidales bacterium]|nr:2-oxoacid:ferredoxin oxidoreductase subunit beta [Bacteroidales bacterium]